MAKIVRRNKIQAKTHNNALKLRNNLYGNKTCFGVIQIEPAEICLRYDEKPHKRAVENKNVQII